MLIQRSWSFMALMSSMALRLLGLTEFGGASDELEAGRGEAAHSVRIGEIDELIERGVAVADGSRRSLAVLFEGIEAGGAHEHRIGEARDGFVIGGDERFLLLHGEDDERGEFALLIEERAQHRLEDTGRGRHVLIDPEAARCEQPFRDFAGVGGVGAIGDGRLEGGDFRGAGIGRLSDRRGGEPDHTASVRQTRGHPGAHRRRSRGTLRLRRCSRCRVRHGCPWCGWC